MMNIQAKGYYPSRDERGEQAVKEEEDRGGF